MCDCKEPKPSVRNANECFVCGEDLSQKQMEDTLLYDSVTASLKRWRPTGERIQDLEKQVKQLRSDLLDLQGVIDELPNIGAAFAAIQELQDNHEAPALKFAHYIGGHRR